MIGTGEPGLNGPVPGLPVAATGPAVQDKGPPGDKSSGNEDSSKPRVDFPETWIWTDAVVG